MDCKNAKHAVFLEEPFTRCGSFACAVQASGEAGQQLRVIGCAGYGGVSGREAAEPSLLCWTGQREKARAIISPLCAPPSALCAAFGALHALRRLNLVVGSYWPCFYSYLVLATTPHFSVTPS